MFYGRAWEESKNTNRKAWTLSLLQNLIKFPFFEIFQLFQKRVGKSGKKYNPRIM